MLISLLPELLTCGNAQRHGSCSLPHPGTCYKSVISSIWEGAPTVRPARRRRPQEDEIPVGAFFQCALSRASAKIPDWEDLREVSAKSQEPQQERPSLLSYPRLRADRALWKNAPTKSASSALPHELEGPPRIIRKHAPTRGIAKKCDARSASRRKAPSRRKDSERRPGAVAAQRRKPNGSGCARTG